MRSSERSACHVFRIAMESASWRYSLSYQPYVLFNKWKAVRAALHQQRSQGAWLFIHPKSHPSQSILQTGTDTSSSAIEWGMALLLNHPTTMVKARAELDEVVARGASWRKPTCQTSPTSSASSRRRSGCTPSPGSSSVAGYDVPAGTMLLVDVHAMHRDARVWEEPERFWPERFEGGRSEGKWMLPFGHGAEKVPRRGTRREGGRPRAGHAGAVLRVEEGRRGGG